MLRPTAWELVPFKSQWGGLLTVAAVREYAVFSATTRFSSFGYTPESRHEGELARISHHRVGRNEQTPTLPELRSPRDGPGNTHGVPAKNGVRDVPATLCDLVPAYGEKCGLVLRQD